MDNGSLVAKAKAPRHREFEGLKFSSSHFAGRSEGLGLQSWAAIHVDRRSPLPSGMKPEFKDFKKKPPWHWKVGRDFLGTSLARLGILTVSIYDQYCFFSTSPLAHNPETYHILWQLFHLWDLGPGTWVPAPTLTSPQWVLTDISISICSCRTLVLVHSTTPAALNPWKLHRKLQHWWPGIWNNKYIVSEMTQHV